MPGKPPAGPRFKFSRAQRLQRGWEFEHARLEGQRIVKGCLVFNWRAVGNQGFSRLGVITSRKIGNAVARARARRLLREVFRHHQQRLRGPIDLVLVARPSIAGKDYLEVERDFVASARQARLIGDSQ